MTPGWTNIRNGLAESYPRPRAMASMRLRTFLALCVLALLLWLGLVSLLSGLP